MREHHYEARLSWDDSEGSTTDYTSYSRNHSAKIAGKPELALSSDPTFRGDAERWNPEELLLVSLSSCHMLWFLHYASEAGIIIKRYDDRPAGLMEEQEGTGSLRWVTLKPRVTISDGSRREEIDDLHARAAKSCFIANSMAFPVDHEPETHLAPIQ